MAEPLQMTAGVSNGERLYSVRYASRQAEANSLYVSNDARDVRQVYPEYERLQHLFDDAALWSPSRSPTFQRCGAKSRPPQR